ncbi:MAG: metal-dependent hydrolase [Planctomycetota bacterium]|jgi:membrane-bound metal-dependent hydrolase YbcI (DUF457 family)
MPFTPYHFGPSGFVGLLFRRWIDVPVFVAANVLIDVEVLADARFAPGWPVHQLWHFHTLLIGALAGAIFGALVYWIKPTRWCSQKSMSLIGLPSTPTWTSMILAGALGACLHVVIDSFYHYDVQLFWPHALNPVVRWIGRMTDLNFNQIKPYVVNVCKIFWVLMFIFYGILLVRNLKRKKAKD